MPDALSNAELNVQQVALLPARTVLSTFTQGSAANGADHFGGISLGIPFMDKIFPGAGSAIGDPGQNANG